MILRIFSLYHHQTQYDDRKVNCQIMKFQARVFVTLRPSVLDPAGTAIKSALMQMDSKIGGGVESVRLGKFVEISLEALNEAEATFQLDQICDRLFANPVIEEYRFEIQA
jgi:phosphoribosylformylglycinamidine synthase subunit PurS